MGHLAARHDSVVPPRAGILARKLSLFAPLSDSDRRVLDALVTGEARLGSGTDIVAEAAVSRSVLLVQKGMAVRYRALPEGGRQIIAFLIPGDLCDPNVLLLRAMDHSVGALTPVAVASLSRNGLTRTFATRPRVSAALWWSSMREESVLRERIVSLGRRDARGRVAYLLCELLSRHAEMGLAEGGSVRLPLTFAELGDALGLTPMHVNRVLRDFHECGLIEKDCGLLTVPDTPSLWSIAGLSREHLHFGGPSPEVARYFGRLEERRSRTNDCLAGPSHTLS